ncbi:MAG: response regulator [Chloroflexi bacterium]|nr:response regulator [Chloroflexota bacterium]MBK6713375.1 response regulator [Chloroflexota bacterium]MBK7176996.1 response regulator [Chloroflexota bacterium]MBK7918371.1 response regulator [Chloroflexota bacterium]MBK8932948.1 response regulator [Chloroflexota bacterium]
MNTLIIVDDDATNVGLLKMLFELDGYAVLACKTIQEAVTAAASGADAFIIDCYLAQGMSGLNLLHDIRAGQTAVDNNAITIMVSGDHRLEKEALANGANAFFLKPYSPNELSKKLQILLSNKGT